MFYSVHNHGLNRKLAYHPIVSRLDCDEKKKLVEMTMIIVNLKLKNHDSV